MDQDAIFAAIVAGLAERHGLTLDTERVASRPGGDQFGPQSRHWRYWLRNAAGVTMRGYYSKGSGLDANPPALVELLESLALDASGAEAANDFDTWCGDYGFDTDSRKALNMFSVCRKVAADLRRMVGDADFEALIDPDYDDDISDDIEHCDRCGNPCAQGQIGYCDDCQASTEG